MTEEIVTTDPQSRFQDFLKLEKYRRALSQMAVEGKSSITVDFEDLLAADSPFAESLVDQPDEYMIHANRAAYAQLQIEEPEYASEKEAVTVRFKGLPETTPLRALGSAHISKLVMV